MQSVRVRWSRPESFVVGWGAEGLAGFAQERVVMHRKVDLELEIVKRGGSRRGRPRITEASECTVLITSNRDLGHDRSEALRNDVRMGG